MIEYSKRESDIFGVLFGRAEIKDTTTDWNAIDSKIKSKKFDFIRLKIKNPTTEQTHQLHQLSKQVHLLEILRVYGNEISQRKDITFAFDDYIYKTVDSSNMDKLISIIENTYEDIPFGNYTSPYILNLFPAEKQRENFIDYYRNEFQKTNNNKTAHIIYNLQNVAIGCIVTEVFKDYTYTNYVGVLKQFRNKHVLTKTINFIQYTYLLDNFPLGFGAARLSNIHSQKAFESNGMFLHGYDFIYLLEI